MRRLDIAILRRNERSTFNTQPTQTTQSLVQGVSYGLAFDKTKGPIILVRCAACGFSCPPPGPKVKNVSVRS